MVRRFPKTMQELTVSLDLWQMVALALISFLVGLLGGFVGLALGTMRLPAIILTGMDPQIAAGTNILVSALAALAGGYQHLREGRVDRNVVLWLGIPSITGAFIGGLFGGLAPCGSNKRTFSMISLDNDYRKIFWIR